MQLSVVASETHEKAVAYFKVAEQYGYKFIMEVREIRDNQYYKALGFGSFEDYCGQAWSTKRDFMDQRITIAEAFGNEWDFADTYRQLGHSKSLLLARMEPERRQEVMNNPQQLPDGSEKTVSEMTVKEMKQLEQRALAAEQRAKQAEAARQLAINQHSRQQDNLLAQIDELKTKGNTSPAVQAHIADLEKQAQEGQRLNNENVLLSRKNQELSQQLTNVKNVDTSLKKVREQCISIMRDLTGHHTVMMMELSKVQGHPEASNLIDEYVERLVNLVSAAQKDIDDIRGVKQKKGVIIDVE